MYITPELFGDVQIVEEDEEVEEDLDPLEEETEPVKPKAVRKRSKTGDKVYDDWVDNLFEWKKRKVAKERARRKPN